MEIVQIIAACEANMWEKTNNPRSCDVTLWCLGKEDNYPTCSNLLKQLSYKWLKIYIVLSDMIMWHYLSDIRWLMSGLCTFIYMKGQERKVDLNTSETCEDACLDRVQTGLLKADHIWWDHLRHMLRQGEDSPSVYTVSGGSRRKLLWCKHPWLWITNTQTIQMETNSPTSMLAYIWTIITPSFRPCLPFIYVYDIFLW